MLEKIYKRILSFAYRKYERIRGIDFLSSVNAQELKFSDNQYKGYATSGDKCLKEVLNTFDVSGEDNIIDIGSGKGHVLHIFNQYPFGKISGIELSKELFEIAKKNFKILNQPNIDIYNVDATKFDNYSGYNFFYMYNPFLGNVMDAVIKNIENSLTVNSREIILIYKNPVCHEIIIKSGIFKKLKELPENQVEEHHKFFIYKNNF